MKDKKIRMPDTMVIIFCIMILAMVLTFIVPGGHYVSRNQLSEGTEYLTLEFEYVNHVMVMPWEIPKLIVTAWGQVSNIMIAILVSGGCMQILMTTGAIDRVIHQLVMITKEKSHRVLIFLTLIFSIATLTMNPHAFVAFVPLTVGIARMLGYDALVGVSVILLGGGVAFSCGMVNIPTMTAQEIVGLPIFSGLWYRLISYLVLLTATIIYILRYAKKIKGKMHCSLVWELEEKQNKELGFDIAVVQHKPPSIKDIIIVVSLFGSFILCFIGMSYMGWGMEEFSSTFLTLGIICGCIGRIAPGELTKIFISGMQKMIGAAIITGFAKTVELILQSGQILDTVVYAMSHVLGVIPGWMYGPVMFIINSLLNVLIVSGGAQAVVVMPILGGISKVLGKSMQLTVLAYNFGDGLSNYILPHSGQLVMYLEQADITYGQWMRYVGKLFLIWTSIALILTLLPSTIFFYGPF